MPHLFVDISCHGYGHLGQTAPVLAALAARLPGLRLTLRSGHPEAHLRRRIAAPFAYVGGASDVSFAMHDAVRVDHAASAAAYRAAHADWPRRVATEAAFLAALAPDLVLANVSYLPLAGARAAGIPALALCSLNWADQFAALFSGDDDREWAPRIHAEIAAAYAGADAFLRCRPATAMPGLDNLIDLPPIAARGRADPAALARATGAAGARHVIVSMGGIGMALPVAGWPRVPGIHWLVRGPLAAPRPDVSDYDALGWHYLDLLASADAIVTKPGYGTFTEAAAAGTPLLYMRRRDWPEQDALIDWLERETVCAEMTAAQFAAGDLGDLLRAVWKQPRHSVVTDGAEVAAVRIAARLPTA